MGARVRCQRCGSVIESKFRHDFVYCKCKTVFVDGGKDYLRIGAPSEKDFVVLGEGGDPTSLATASTEAVK
jgi:hypothetical protein